MRTRTGSILASVLATALSFTAFSTSSSPAPGRAPSFSTQVFQFRLEGSQVVPPVSTDGLGSCTVTLDDQTGAYTVSGDYACLRGDVTNVHFHGPAGIGQEAPVIALFGNTGGTAGTFSKTGTLTSQQVQDLLNGLVYVQLHSTFRLSGELRGQVVPCATAGVSVRNGSGVNPLVLSSPTTPVLNTAWSASLDCAGHAPSVAVLFVHARPSSGTIVGAGEILVRTAGKRLFRASVPHSGNVVTFGAPIPDDTSLCGLTAHAQAVVFGSPGPTLTNALELVLGR